MLVPAYWTGHQAHHYIATLDILGVYFVFFPVFELELILVLLVLRFGITRRPVSRLLSAIKKPHTRPQPKNWPRCPPYHPCGCLPGALSQISFWKQNGERRRGERQKRKEGRGRVIRKERGEYELCSNATKRCKRVWIGFIFFARFSYMGMQQLFFLFYAGRWQILPVLN